MVILNENLICSSDLTEKLVSNDFCVPVCLPSKNFTYALIRKFIIVINKATVSSLSLRAGNYLI